MDHSAPEDQRRRQQIDNAFGRLTFVLIEQVVRVVLDRAGTHPSSDRAIRAAREAAWKLDELFDAFEHPQYEPGR
jgi:hypothetical protein